MKFYQQILEAKKRNQKLLAVLIDPDKVIVEKLPVFFDTLHKSVATHIFIGGSTDENNKTSTVVSVIKKLTHLPVILFPGDYKQITNTADAILFLSLLSGRNSDFLIEQQVKAAPILTKTDLEIIPTGYILVDGGVVTSVEKVSKTKPISQNNVQLIVDTALAGNFLGKKLIYLEAGSGATVSVDASIISSVKKSLNIPLIVGGGIRSKKQLKNAYNAGADLVVIGTAFEQNLQFFNELKKEHEPIF